MTERGYRGTEWGIGEVERFLGCEEDGESMGHELRHHLTVYGTGTV